MSEDYNFSLTKVLLIEEDLLELKNTLKIFQEIVPSKHKITFVTTIQEANIKIEENKFDIVLYTLNKKQEEVIIFLKMIKTRHSYLPVLLLAKEENENEAFTLLKEGAQDYLVKSSITKELLNKSIQYAIERQKLLLKIQSLSLTDELTGLLNRRGFFELAKQQLKLSARDKKETFLLFLDLDGLKKINDAFGHSYGDDALQNTAKILKETFRESDIIARIGGDEFLIFTSGVNEDGLNIIIERLLRNIEAFNQSFKQVYKLSLSIGKSKLNAGINSIDDMLKEADKLMYEEKRRSFKG